VLSGAFIPDAFIIIVFATTLQQPTHRVLESAIYKKYAMSPSILNRVS